MKKTLAYSFILTCILIFAPAFMVQYDSETKQSVNSIQVNKNLKIDKNNNYLEKNSYYDNISVFSSNTCFKKTYYIGSDNVKVHEDASGNDKLEFGKLLKFFQ